MAIVDPTIHPTAFCAPGAHVFGDVTIGELAVVMFGVVIRAEDDRIEIGARTNVQDNAVLHCDEGIPCLVGAEVTIGHAAVVHGAVVGDHCLVGIGARALNDSVMGEGSWLAAGSLLPEGREIPPWTLAMGVPAKPVRELTEDEISRQRSGVGVYLSYAQQYLAYFEN
jgi:carbonic anhydrase/acetyltransferase-like protein (isoleucine patch superfamily)